ncbi:MAG TPA: carboxymuconolactone decarboxylase family protein [Methanotrichaceae archaeon]|nr:carboxymuconolactone decarboxylase family protein [Methanotrichaceae archaeon]HQF17081.1 carboxymuconolactone decarboxylase family protein [Methanotrichaceae archaeon]HQI91702.1 carboxymuconolactone decarboxylase family protein [Methanotrichaceae archaeon]
MMRCLGDKMGGYVPETLKAIYEAKPELVEMIERMDRVLLEDGALDRKTKRLIALACVATRMCEDCIYPQAKVAMNYGATKEEILEALEVCMITGGVPTFSVAKKGIARLFRELEED